MSINSATAPGSWISRLSPLRRTAAIILVILAVTAAILLAVTHMRPHAPVLPAAQANMLGLRMAEAAENRDDATVRALLKQGANPDRPSRDGTPALLWATHFANTAQVKLLLAYGANVNAASRYGLTALHLASAQGNAGIARILIAAGAKADTPDKVGETPLMMAARQGAADITAMLLKAGAPVNAREPIHGVTALMLAGWFSHPDVTRELLDAGADINLSTKIGPTPKPRPPNPPGGGSHGDGIIRSGIPPQGERAPIAGGMTALLYAVRAGDLESAKMLMAAGAPLEKGEANGVRPLLMAILDDRMDLANYFIGLGANVNATDWYGRSPLWSAVDIRDVELATDGTPSDVDRPAVLKLIDLLLRKGANPNWRLPEFPPVRMWLMQGGTLSWVDFTGQTPFLRAALSGDVTVMKLLIKYHADPNIPTLRGTTPLMAAAGVNWVFFQTFDEGEDQLLEAIKLCMHYGQDVNAVNSMKVTALDGAANRGSNKIIQFLVDHGARLDAADDQGRTPLTWAQGVFLATLPAQAKPASIALITKLCAERNLQCEGHKVPPPTDPASTGGLKLGTGPGPGGKRPGPAAGQAPGTKAPMPGRPAPIPTDHKEAPRR